MMNYVWDFSQSETDKDFVLITMIYDQKYENGSNGRQSLCENFEAVR